MTETTTIGNDASTTTAPAPPDPSVYVRGDGARFPKAALVQYQDLATGRWLLRARGSMQLVNEAADPFDGVARLGEPATPASAQPTAPAVTTVKAGPYVRADGSTWARDQLYQRLEASTYILRTRAGHEYVDRSDHPFDAVAVRLRRPPTATGERVLAHLSSHPDASVRALARAAGVALSTAARWRSLAPRPPPAS